MDEMIKLVLGFIFVVLLIHLMLQAGDIKRKNKAKHYRGEDSQ